MKKKKKKNLDNSKDYLNHERIRTSRRNVYCRSSVNNSFGLQKMSYPVITLFLFKHHKQIYTNKNLQTGV